MSFQTLAVNQRPAYGTDYPFRNRPPASARYLLGDLYLVYDDDSQIFTLPLRIATLTGFDQTGSFRRDIVVKDAGGVTVFDSTDAADYTDTAWGKNARTLSWTTDTGVLRVTMRTSPPEFDSGVTWGATITLTGNTGVLDSRTYMRMPRRVKSLRVGLQKFTGNVVLTEGFNAQLTAAARPTVDGGRRTRQIRMRFRPGDGLGRVPGCDDVEPVVKRINTVGPSDGGDFTLDVPDCYRVQRPVTVISESPRTVTPTYLPGTVMHIARDNLVDAGHLSGEAQTLAAAAALQLFNDCGQCCTCDDYVRTYDGLRGVFNRFASIGRRAEAVRDTYADNVDRWNRQKACRLLQSLRLVLAAEPKCRLFIGGLHCNMTAGCVQPLILRVTIQTFNNGTPSDMSDCAQPKCRESKRAGADTKYDEKDFSGVAVPVFDIPFDRADSQGTSRFRTRLSLCCDDNGLDTVRVTLSVHIRDGAAVDSDGNVLPLPDPVTLPGDVTALWTGAPSIFPARAYVQKTVPVAKTSGCGGGC